MRSRAMAAAVAVFQTTANALLRKSMPESGDAHERPTAVLYQTFAERRGPRRRSRREIRAYGDGGSGAGFEHFLVNRQGSGLLRAGLPLHNIVICGTANVIAAINALLLSSKELRLTVRKY